VVLALIIAIGLIGVAATLIIRALALPNRRSVERVEAIGSYGFEGTSTSIDTGGEAEDQVGPIDRLASSVGEFMGRRISVMRETELRRRLVTAGMYSTSPRKFVGYQVLSAAAFAILGFYLATSISSSKVLSVFVLVFTLVVGWFVPLAYVSSRTRRRRDQIDYELPELIDLLVVTVEAGIGFVGSMRIAAQHVRDPLGQELRLTLQEQSMGLASTEALANMLERADTPGMRMFVRAIVQGETLGVSIGQIMRNLALEMRKRRKARAEEKAQKAPIKMLFPLIFLIFPAMFVVLLLPAMIKIVDTLSS
jgi:tight adherence protein C